MNAVKTIEQVKADVLRALRVAGGGKSFSAAPWSLGAGAEIEHRVHVYDGGKRGRPVGYVAFGADEAPDCSHIDAEHRAAVEAALA